MPSATVWPHQNIESVIKLENSSFAIACDVLDLLIEAPFAHLPMKSCTGIGSCLLKKESALLIN